MPTYFWGNLSDSRCDEFSRDIWINGTVIYATASRAEMQPRGSSIRDMIRSNSLVGHEYPMHIFRSQVNSI
jgi:hypothetical protein